MAAAAAPRGRGGASGALVALAGWAKFAPLALAPLFAAHRRGGALRFAAAFAGVTLLCGALVLGSGGLETFADRTLGFQGSRDAPFSVWGQLGDGWAPVQTAVQGAAVLLAVALAFVPRRRDAVGLAALSAAILIATQLGVTLLVLPLRRVVPGARVRRDPGARREPGQPVGAPSHGTSSCSIASARRGCGEQRMSTPMSHGSSCAVSKRTDMCVAQRADRLLLDARR